jgi:hypothetical protein
MWLGQPLAFITLLPLALTTAAVGAVVVIASSLLRRPADHTAARHVDSRFQLRELLESAARLPDSPASPFHHLISARAASAIRAIPPVVAVPIRWTPRLSAAATCVLAFATVTLSLPQLKPVERVAAEASVPLADARPARSVWASRPPALTTAPPALPDPASGQQSVVAALPPLTQPGAARDNRTFGGTAPPDASPGQGAAESPLIPTEFAPQAPSPSQRQGPPLDQPGHATAAGDLNEPAMLQPSSSAPQPPAPWPSASTTPEIAPRAGASVAVRASSSPLRPASPRDRGPGDGDPAVQNPEMMNADIPEHARELVRQYFSVD